MPRPSEDEGTLEIPNGEVEKVEHDHNIVPDLVIGERCFTLPSKHRGLVKFVGEIPSLPSGYWVGIMFDDKVGKNDGMLNGKRFFNCPAGHGGFLRPNKVCNEAAVQRQKEEEAMAAAEKERKRTNRGGAGANTQATAPAVDSSTLVLEEHEMETHAPPLSRAAKTERQSAGRKSQRHAKTSRATIVKKRRSGAACGPNCTVAGSGLTTAHVGTLAQFTITGHNESGQRCMKGGDQFTVLIRGRGVLGSQPSQVRTKITDRLDGTYMVEYKTWMSGAYIMTIHDSVQEAVLGSPFELNIITMRPEASLCAIWGPGLRHAVARKPNKFEISFIDSTGAPCLAEELDVFVEWSEDQTPLVLNDGSDDDESSKAKAAGRVSPARVDDAQNNSGGQLSARGGRRLLDVETRQRHEQLWTSRASLDKWQQRQAAPGQKKKNSKAGAAWVPTYTQEITENDPYGFAFGGITPGVLHSRGKIAKVHNANFSIGKAGRYKLFVLLRQQMLHLPGSPFDLMVSPGAGYAFATRIPEDCQVLTGNASEDWQLGLVLRLSDMLSNTCVEGGAKVVFELDFKQWLKDHPGYDDGEVRKPPPIECQVIDKGDGSYELSWKGIIAGNFSLDVSVDNSRVQGSPIQLTVLPGIPSVSDFTVSGSGLKHAKAGEQGVVQVKLADCFGNPASPLESTTFGLDLIAARGQDAGMNGNEIAKGKKAVGVGKTNARGQSAKIFYRGDDAWCTGGDSMPVESRWVPDEASGTGSYILKYLPRESGTLHLHAWSFDETGERVPLPGSPFEVVVAVGSASASGSYLHANESSPDLQESGGKIVAGEKLTVRPQVRDTLGNDASAPEGALTAVLEAPGVASGDAEHVEVIPGKGGTGSYEVCVEPTGAGQHMLRILLHGESVAGSPLSFTVTPAPFVDAEPKSVNKCRFFRSAGAPPPVVNANCELTLQVIDRFGNVLTNGGHRVDAKAAGAATSSCNVVDQNNGLYTISLTAGAPGDVKVTARVEGMEVGTVSLTFSRASDARSSPTSAMEMGSKGDDRAKTPELEASETPELQVQVPMLSTEPVDDAETTPLLDMGSAMPTGKTKRAPLAKKGKKGKSTKDEAFLALVTPPATPKGSPAHSPAQTALAEEAAPSKNGAGEKKK